MSWGCLPHIQCVLGALLGSPGFTGSVQNNLHEHLHLPWTSLRGSSLSGSAFSGDLSVCILEAVRIYQPPIVWVRVNMITGLGTTDLGPLVDKKRQSSRPLAQLGCSSGRTTAVQSFCPMQTLSNLSAPEIPAPPQSGFCC